MPSRVEQFRYNWSASEGAGNTARTLTDSLDYTKEWLAMNPTPIALGLIDSPFRRAA